MTANNVEEFDSSDEDGDLEWEDEDQVARVREVIRTTAPRCINDFRRTPTDSRLDRPDHDLVTSWRLACGCGHEKGYVLGFSLADFNTTYVGPLEFVRPVSFECSKCRRVMQIVDKHGYNEEVARMEGGVGSATFRGTGIPMQFHCHHCNASEFEVQASFIYSPGAFDLFLDFPEVPAQDFFDLVHMSGKCCGCGESSVIAYFEG
jgi:hypothetical protein